MSDEPSRQLRNAFGQLTGPPSPGLQVRVKAALEAGSHKPRTRHSLQLVPTLLLLLFVGALVVGARFLRSPLVQPMTSPTADTPLTGVIRLVAGGGTGSATGQSGDRADAKTAMLGSVAGLVVDPQRNVYIADNKIPAGRGIEQFSEIRQILSTGAIRTIRGTQGGRLTTGLAIDRHGNLFFSVARDGAIWKYSVDTGQVILIAGGGPSGYSGNVPLSVQAARAGLYAPTALALDPNGDVYIADTYNNSVRKVSAANGTIARIAGIGTPGYSGDNGPAINAQLNQPMGLAFDTTGNLYIADSGNQVVRLVNLNTGTIKTVAGSGKAGYSGDGSVASRASFYQPRGLAVDAKGNLFVADTGNSVIREIIKNSGTIYTVVGKHRSPASDAEYKEQLSAMAARDAELTGPESICFDAKGSLLIADTGNSLVREVVPAGQ